MMMTTATMISTHGFNMPGFAIVDAASWLVVLVVPDKVEESDDEAPLPVTAKIGVCFYAVNDCGSLG
jgi:hypothetical protein